LEHQLRRVLEGLFDVRRVLFEQGSSEVGEATAEAVEDPDEVVHEVISRIYGMQRGYEAELSELRHRVKMQQMRIDEAESLRFDIELLNDEKAMLSAEVEQANATAADLAARLAESQRSSEEASAMLERELRQSR
jgi:predicted RNase H-like nuclease (RuvC/YqgF family)